MKKMCGKTEVKKREPFIITDYETRIIKVP